MRMGTRPARKRAIVNADDLGFSEGTTAGILKAHREGIVTSATIVANMPASEAAARHLAEAPELGVGVHLNVSQGRPLSKSGQALADEDGLMRHTGAGILLACTLRPWLLRAVGDEFDAQIRWALDHGIRPTHLDSHRHSHGFPLIFPRVAGLAKRYGIRFARWYRERLPGNGWGASPAGQRRNRALLNLCGAVNSIIEPSLRGTLGTWGIAHTGLIDADFLARVAAAVRPGVTEIAVHPGLGEDLSGKQTRLLESRRIEVEALCGPATRQAFERNAVELIHYGQI